ncbi:hypothetical protein SAY86_004138 [Trapa natans]|uniref:Uncharacterized protein n=1 Tax=Trapa natans TaxID=22666 RepID=A0AAN7N387_TRANT|nr:hypothetical protein SAY86_004138 [Trapa natans]
MDNGTSWADQSDNELDPLLANHHGKKSESSTAAKYKQKVGEGLKETKTAVSHGFKKMKESALGGSQQIKNKYEKLTNI